MTKNVSNRPGAPPVAPLRPSTLPAAKPESATKKATAADKVKDKKISHRNERQPVQRQQRPQRIQGPSAPAAGGAEEHGEEGGGGVGGISAAESPEDLNRRRSSEVESAREAAEFEVEPVEEAHDSAATGADSVKRSKGGSDQGSSDGFDDGKQQREAYERLMKGNVKVDAQRFDDLRKKGLKDGFNPESPPADVESQGVPRTASHVVRMFDHWTLDGVPREESVEKMALWMSKLSTPQAVRKVLTEMESKPIRDVYPLELLIHLLEHRPEVVPNVKKGAVLANLFDLNASQKILAGHGIQLHVPADTRIKSLALLGGTRPGYEFYPTPNCDNRYTLLIDTPGRWVFALLAVPLINIGRIQKEGPDAILEIFSVTVNAMGKKGEPLSPEDWAAQKAMTYADDGDADDGDADDGDADDGAAAAAAAAVKLEPAGILILQIRHALETISRDEVQATAASTYSWDLRLYAPGRALDGEGVLHLVVSKAGPFDPVWARAREAIIQKQREYEPGRALLTPQDLANAIRRARVR